MEDTLDKNTVRLLIAGSRKLDQMKADINKFVNIVIGLIQLSREFDAVSGSGTKIPCFPGWDGYWKMETTSTSGRMSGPVSLMYFKMHDVNATYSSNTWEHKTDLSMGDVQIVYKDLRYLLDGLLKIFPSLSTIWKPIMDAATVEL